MKRIMMVLTVALVMAAMMAVTASTAFAQLPVPERALCAQDFAFGSHVFHTGFAQGIRENCL